MTRARLAILIIGLVLVGVVLLGADRPRRGRRGAGVGAVADSPVIYDAAVDGGVIWAAVMTGPSYFHLGGGSAQAPVWIAPQRCQDDATVCAYQAQDGGVVAAVDLDAGAAASIGAIQMAARLSGQPWVLVDWQQPQTASWAYDVAQLEANLTGAAAWATDAGHQLCPLFHQEVVGGYYGASAGLPFIDGGTAYAPDSGSHMELIERDLTRRLRDHVSMLADAGYAISGDCVGSLPYYDLKGPQSGTSLDAGVLAQMPYSGDWATYGTYGALLDTSGVEVQTDGLHFNRSGHQQAADMLGRLWAGVLSDGNPTRFAPTAISVVDADTLDVTFAVPCRVRGDCEDDPPLAIDVVGRVAQETYGAVSTYGLHFWHSGVLLTPGAVSSATPQSCATGQTSCVVRFDFASLPDFDEVTFGDLYCKVFGDADCSFGGGGVYGGGSNVIARVNTTCGGSYDGGVCYEQPSTARISVTSYDAGPGDGGFVANTQYLAATSGNYTSAANQGGGSAQCIFAWGTLPTSNLDTIIRPATTQRGFLGNIGGAWGCAISSTGPTYRVASGSYTTGNRYDVACCYSGGGAGPTGINIWVGGALVNGTTNGAATALDSDGAWDMPDTNASTSVDEVVVMPGKTTLTASELLTLRCSTKAASDSSPTSGECAIANTGEAYVCGLAAGTRWYGFEGNATDRCGVLDGTETGSPPYTSYP